MLNVTEEWLESWRKVKSLLRPYGDTASYFTKPEIAGYQMDIIELGIIKFPTGEFLVRDPLVYLPVPKYQRSAGDWINWTIPDTELSLPMFASGWGDGTYPVYFGLDENGEVCQLIVELISLEYIAAHENDTE